MSGPGRAHHLAGPAAALSDSLKQKLAAAAAAAAAGCGLRQAGGPGVPADLGGRGGAGRPFTGSFRRPSSTKGWNTKLLMTLIRSGLAYATVTHAAAVM